MLVLIGYLELMIRVVISVMNARVTKKNNILVEFNRAWRDLDRRPSDDRPMLVGCQKRDPDIVEYRDRSAGDRMVAGRLPSVYHPMILEYCLSDVYKKNSPVIGRCLQSSEDYRPVPVRCASDAFPMLGCRNEIGRI